MAHHSSHRQTEAPAGSKVYDELIYGAVDKKRYTVEQGKDEDPVYLDVHTNIKRELALQEILDTEKTYINNVLKVLHESYFVKIMGHHDLFSADTIKVIFSNIIEIEQVHTEWIKDLEEACRKKTDKDKKKARIVSGVFSEFSMKLKCYQEFCGLVPSAIELVTSLLKNKKIAAVLGECRANSGQRFGLKDLLPVIPQRIQKYPILLEALHKATPSGHPDKVALLSTMENMTMLTQYINDVKVEKDSVREYQSRLKEYKGESLVLLGKLFCQVECGMLAGKGKKEIKVEAVSVLMFQKGLLLSKYNWKDLKNKQKSTTSLSETEIANIFSLSKLSYENFFDLIKVQSVTELSPAGMPDMGALQTNVLDVESYTSGWTIEAIVKGGSTEVFTFVASRENQKLFCTKYNSISDGGVKQQSQGFKINKQSWNFPRSAVEKGMLLGEGNFGQVYKGTLSGKVTIAIKIFKGDITSDSEFYKEVETLASITKSMNHHLLQFYGIVPPEKGTTDTLPMMMLTEYLDLGSLQSYIRKFARKRNLKSFHDMAGYAEQILDGMAHLESIGFVHRDLAARNVLVGSGDGTGEVCKIADFGLSRVLNKDGQFLAEAHMKLPYKWTAPEALVEDDPIFTTKSDVWSFGVLLAELFTYGVTPYKDIRDPLMLLNQLQQGFRLKSPRGIPVPFYEKMLECWRGNPADRPSFENLLLWTRKYWTATDLEQLYGIGYSKEFCDKILQEKNGSVRQAATFLYAVLDAEFEMQQSGVESQGAFKLKLDKATWAPIDYPDPNMLAVRYVNSGGNLRDDNRRKSPNRSNATSPRSPSLSPTPRRAMMGRTSRDASPSRGRTPSPRADRLGTMGQHPRLKELFSSGSKSSPGFLRKSEPISNEVNESTARFVSSTAVLSPTLKDETDRRRIKFTKHEFPGFESDEDNDQYRDAQDNCRWQVQKGSGWENLPKSVSLMIEYRYKQNQGHADYTINAYRYRIDFGSNIQYRLDNHSVNVKVRRVVD